MTSQDVRSQMFVADLPFCCRLADDGTMRGELEVVDELRAPGSAAVRPAVLATVADVFDGILASRWTAPRLALTLDIDVRTVAPAIEGDRLSATGRLLKAGRTIIATETEFVDPTSGSLFATAYLSFMASPRPQDLSPGPMVGHRPLGRLHRPLEQHVGARVLGPGVVEVDHVPFVVQPSGTLMGGVVALLGEMAAESAAGRPVRDLDVRYLSAIRVGPARATASALGDGQLRVEVRDSGNDDRLAARVSARI